MGAFDRQLAAALHAPATEDDWLSESRASARARWLGETWPTRKTEAWKYTSLEALETESWLRLPGSLAQPAPAPRIPGLDADYIVFRNGRFDAAASSIQPSPGVTLSAFSMAGAAEREFLAAQLGCIEAEAPSLFAALAGCWSTEGVLLRLARGAVAPRPVCVVHLAEPGTGPCAWGQRLFLQAAAGSQATLIEYFPAGGSAFVPGLTEIVLEAGARLRHLRLQLDATDAVHLGSVHASVGASAAYDGLVFATGSRLKRLDLRTAHQGPGAEVRMDGVYLARGREVVDIHTAVDHASPHGHTTQSYRGIVDDEARAVFNGRILIRPGAAKTAASLSNRNLLASDRAEVDSKPELEIYADDVSCSHGATVSRIDGKSLYYLRSRGVSRADAEIMLAFGFLNELLSASGVPAVQALLESELRGWFALRPVGVVA